MHHHPPTHTRAPLLLLLLQGALQRLRRTTLLDRCSRYLMSCQVSCLECVRVFACALVPVCARKRVLAFSQGCHVCMCNVYGWEGGRNALRTHTRAWLRNCYAAASHSRASGAFATGVPRIQGEEAASAQGRAADYPYPTQHRSHRHQDLLTCPSSSYSPSNFPLKNLFFERCGKILLL